MNLTSEADSACAVVSAGHVLAGSFIHAWVGLTFVVIDVAILPAPARVTSTFISLAEIKDVSVIYIFFLLFAAH